MLDNSQPGLSSIPKRINEWQRKLLDLSRKNPLVYYRQTKSYIHISHPDIQSIYQTLVVERKPLKFTAAILNDLEETYSPQENELVCHNLSRGDLKKALKSLTEKPATFYKEYGIRTLYIAFGLLHWKESESSNERSPLILCPVELKREKFPESFILSLVEDDDISINPAFQVKLKRDFNLDLPPAPEEWEVNSIQEYLAQVNQFIKPDKSQWSIEPNVILGVFKFNNIGIYKDLVENSSFIEEHPLIRILSGEQPESHLVNDIPSDKQLDKIQKPESTFQFLEADSSQQRCIQAALLSKNLVIDGPPGTGKSQTIANIIAEFIARGKTVLFVSAKIAALEVVYKKLKDSNLADFCLELHSQKAKKTDVQTELKRCLEASTPEEQLPNIDIEFKKLERTRKQLNDYVLALHMPRGNLNESVSSILGKLAELHQFPLIEIHLTNPNNISSEWIQQHRELVVRLETVWEVVKQGEAFPWFNCSDTKFDSETKSWWRSHLEHLISTVNTLHLTSGELSNFLGANTASTLNDVHWLISLSNHLSASPVPDANWLTINDLESLFKDAKQYQNLSNNCQEIRAQLKQRYKETFFDLAPQLAVQINAALNQVALLLGTNESNRNQLFETRQKLLIFFEETERLLLRDFCQEAIELAGRFGIPTDNINLDRIDELAELAILTNSLVRPDGSWLNPERIRQIRYLIEEIRPKYQEYNRIRDELLTQYDDSFFELDIDKLIKRFNSIWWKNKFLRWFNPWFHKDKADILRTTRNPELPSSILADLHQARRLKHRLQEFENNRSRDSALLGAYDQGLRTNFDLVENALSVADDVVRLARVSPIPERLVQVVASGYPPQVDLNASANQIREGIQQWEATARPFSSLIRMGRLPRIGSGFRQANLSNVEQWVQDSITSLRSLCELTEGVLTHCIAQPPDSLATLLADLDKNEQWRSLLSQLNAASDSLIQKFGNRYRGLDTDWVELLNALLWTKQARNLFNDRVPEPFIQLATKQDNRAIPFEPVLSGYSSVVELCKTIQGRFSPAQLTTCGTPYQELPLSAIGARAYTLLENVNLLELWVNYTAIKRQFISLRFDNFLRKLQQSSPLPPVSQLSDILYKSVYQAWANAIFEEDSHLTNFYGREHEQVVKEFRDCDRSLIRLAKQRVIHECNARKHKYISTGAAQREIALLKKRGKELRKLFEEIPSLLLKLKPCLMMSPASVSKFISLQKIEFDVVIFDEASQLSTEEAVGAVCRGKQFIVAGDNQQLPPTSFFKSSFVVDEDDEDEDEDYLPPGFKSLLDESEAILRKVYLKWHYRSQHESLIAFSNERFYNGELITFPSRQSEPSEDLGVKFIYVPDGVYDGAKGRKKNIIEAQRVVEEIFNHFTRYPHTEYPHRRSLGVVTFSESQMDAIKEVLEKQLDERPEFNRFFAEDLLEGFFVKNLENVQGDERDVVILSIGYGPDPQGRVYSRFGPITQEGGHKRLNVAVTRARQKFIVVSSITADKINIRETSKPGLLNLYDYLRYAQHGSTALALTNPQGTEEAESPFEEDVAKEIRALGYLVTHQVGCSGYRIDIGVSHPSNPGYFLLGVECDGATYHSAATARDRDRLRQQVLEKLGWKIHRIWSPDWWKRRTTEVERLSQVLEETYQNYLTKIS